MKTVFETVTEMQADIEFLQKLLNTLSLINIHYHCENFLLAGLGRKSTRDLCVAALDQRKLDEIYVRCYEQLADLYQQEAVRLRAWLDAKAQR